MKEIEMIISAIKDFGGTALTGVISYFVYCIVRIVLWSSVVVYIVKTAAQTILKSKNAYQALKHIRDMLGVGYPGRPTEEEISRVFSKIEQLKKGE